MNICLDINSLLLRLILSEKKKNIININFDINIKYFYFTNFIYLPYSSINYNCLLNLYFNFIRIIIQNFMKFIY